MKLINSAIMAQAVYGTSIQGTTGWDDPAHAGGWALFLMSGTVPTTDSQMAAAFNQKSIADLFNKSLGIVRQPLLSVSNGTILNLRPRAPYVPKGVSLWGTVGSVSLSQILPNRIRRTASTDRAISRLMCTPSAGGDYMTTVGAEDFVIEFDTAVRFSHYKRYGTDTVNGTWVAVADNGTETSLGTATALAADTSVFAFSNPQTSKVFKLKYLANTAHAPFAMLSDTEQPTATELTLPTWAVFAHVNTFVHGSFEATDDLMFIADTVGDMGPFQVVGPFAGNKANIIYCPKIRFLPRSV
ncbi:hypothetical protein pEaSNUABM5_00085 [Erwinia phage pEa_SNUABM_5]|uniref:Uncharacterized protein n=1 Tax=Erwinia phage pEa_SNUABM_5 TaxID=2797313 RepID=A0A7T8IVZ5_9CAUD|nr:hypothetical protein MPK73_gp085 [Erwinia phage pEa_SNUABM_5]QQO90227.1 hypothetical protein pEaSNUABM5_00085 [Erwinia phage pEa_SNUABM_5]